MVKPSSTSVNQKPVNLLIIAYYFPPARVVGAIRLFYFYTHLKAIANTINVLSTSNRRFMPEDETLNVDELSIVCVPTLDARRWVLRKNKRQGKESAQHQQTRRLTFLRRLAHVFPFSWLTADGGVVYIWNGYRSGKRMVRDQHITHILSSYRPYADHCIAYLLKRKFPDLVWVADYRDLPLSLPGWKSEAYPWKKWERALLSKADLITTVSEGLKKSFEQFQTPALVIRNGIDESNSDELPVYTDRFLIQYTGSLYTGKQDPALLFRVLRKLIGSGALPKEKIWIRYVGPHARQWEALVNPYALPGEALDVVPRQDALQIQRQAHLNILLTWAGSGQYGIMTAKLGEYLAARRPILCLINGGLDDEMESVIHAYNQGLTSGVHLDEADRLADYIITLFRLFQQNPAHPFFTNDRNMDALHWATQIEALGRVISDD